MREAAADRRPDVRDRPLRVGMLVGSVGERGGGVPASVRDMAQAIGLLPGVEVSAFACANAPCAADVEAWAPIELRLFRKVGPSTFGYARGLDRALASAQIDVLHVHGLWMYISIAARTWSRRTRRAYVVSPHGMLDGWALASGFWKKRLALGAYERGHLEGAACVHALCEAERAAVRSFGLVNPVCVISNGVGLPSGSRPAPKSETARRTLLFLGRLTPKKGLVALVEAWAGARGAPGSERWDLEIAGAGETGFVADLEALVDRLGVRSSTRFVGHRAGAAKTETFLAADAFVLPSVSEGQPLAALEAWAHGLPALLTPQCNLPEGFAASAALAIGASRDEIAAGLERLFALPDEARVEMGRRGRRLAEQTFSWRAAAERWTHAYRWAAGAAGQPEFISIS